MIEMLNFAERRFGRGVPGESLSGRYGLPLFFLFSLLIVAIGVGGVGA